MISHQTFENEGSIKIHRIQLTKKLFEKYITKFLTLNCYNKG